MWVYTRAQWDIERYFNTDRPCQLESIPVFVLTGVQKTKFSGLQQGTEECEPEMPYTVRGRKVNAATNLYLRKCSCDFCHMIDHNAMLIKNLKNASC